MDKLDVRKHEIVEIKKETLPEIFGECSNLTEMLNRLERVGLYIFEGMIDQYWEEFEELAEIIEKDLKLALEMINKLPPDLKLDEFIES